VKGCGEAGCAGAMTSVMNAVLDALRGLGIEHFDMPASPQRIWKTIAQHRGQSVMSQARKLEGKSGL
jgi:carbon-monoxide dehydrogenase large subunit